MARIVRRRTLGFSHLEEANRPGLMLETLVTDTSKPYHRFFSTKTVETADERLRAMRARAATGFGRT